MKTYILKRYFEENGKDVVCFVENEYDTYEMAQQALTVMDKHLLNQRYEIEVVDDNKSSFYLMTLIDTTGENLFCKVIKLTKDEIDLIKKMSIKELIDKYISDVECDKSFCHEVYVTIINHQNFDDSDIVCII